MLSKTPTRETVARPRTLKAVILVDDPYVYYNGGLKRYTGFVYDIWQTCKQDVRDVYRFKETYVATTNYTKVLKEYLVDKRYDIAVGAFSMLYERSSYVRFTRPFVLNRHVVVHKPSLHWTSTLPTLFVHRFLPLLCAFLLLGLVMYGVAYALHERRSAEFTNILSAIVGNRDYLDSHESDYKHHMPLMIIFVVLLIFSTFSATFLSGYMTTALLKAYKTDSFTTDTIHTKHLLCAKGFSSGKVFEALGANVDYKEGSETRLTKLYDRSNVYDGIALSYFGSVQLVKRTGWQATETIFGMDMNAFALRKDHDVLADALDLVILKRIRDFTVANACTLHLGPQSRYLGIL